MPTISKAATPGLVHLGTDAVPPFWTAALYWKYAAVTTPMHARRGPPMPTMMPKHEPSHLLGGGGGGGDWTVGLYGEVELEGDKIGDDGVVDGPGDLGQSPARRVSTGS